MSTRPSAAEGVREVVSPDRQLKRTSALGSTVGLVVSVGSASSSSSSTRRRRALAKTLSPPTTAAWSPSPSGHDRPFYNALRDVVILAIPVELGEPPQRSPSLRTSRHLALADRLYAGVLTDDMVLLNGHMPWRRSYLAGGGGVASAYATQIGFAKESNGFVANGSLVLSEETGRRLSEAAGEPVLPSLPMESLLAGLQGIISAAIPIVALISDLLFHVVYTLLSLLFKILETFILVAVAGAAIVEIFNSAPSPRS